MTKKSPEFQFEVDSAQSLDAATVLEAAGMFIGARVHGSTASTQFASYHVEGNSARKWVILGKQENYDSTTQADELLPFHYALMAGFYTSNISICYSGPNAECLPGKGTLVASKSRVGFVSPFRDLSSTKPAKVVKPALLEVIHQAFKKANTMEQLLESGDFQLFPNAGLNSLSELLKHKSGLLLQVERSQTNSIESHRIHGFRSGLMMQENPAMSKTIMEVRTWGEAWVAHQLGPKPFLKSMVAFPDEVGIFTDQVYRYRVRNPKTLLRLSSVTFGEGNSKVYSRSDFLGFAKRYFVADNLDAGLACLQQARLLSETPSDLAEIVRLTPRLGQFQWSKQPPSQYPITDLAPILGQDGLQRVLRTENDRKEEYAYQDYGRNPMQVPGVHYGPFTDEQLFERGLTPQVLSLLLGLPVMVGVRPKKLPKLFCFCIDNHTVWGADSSECYLLEGQSNAIFGSANQAGNKGKEASP